MAAALVLAVSWSLASAQEAVGTSPESGAPTAAEVKKEAQEALETAGDYAGSKAAKYEAELTKRLDQLDGKLAQLEKATTEVIQAGPRIWMDTVAPALLALLIGFALGRFSGPRPAKHASA
jgi:hypothetical protein